MIDAYVRMRRGERRPIYAQAAAASGTLTVQSGSVVTLADRDGAAVSGFAGIAATGWDSGALASPRVWFLLDASALAAGFYTLTFAFSALGSDGMARSYRPLVEIEVM